MKGQIDTNRARHGLKHPIGLRLPAMIAGGEKLERLTAFRMLIVESFDEKNFASIVRLAFFVAAQRLREVHEVI
jgi:hypothetical protein